MQVDFLAKQAEKYGGIKSSHATEDKSEWPLVYHALNHTVSSLIGYIETIINQKPNKISDEAVKDINRNIYFAKRLLETYPSLGSRAERFRDTIEDLQTDLLTAIDDEESAQQPLEEISAKFQQTTKANQKMTSSVGYQIRNGDNEADVYGDFDDELMDNITVIKALLAESLQIFFDMPPMFHVENFVALGFDDDVLEQAVSYIDLIDYGDFQFELTGFADDHKTPTYHLTLVDENDEIPAGVEIDSESILGKSQLGFYARELGNILGRYCQENMDFRLKINQFHRDRDHDEQNGELCTSYSLD